MVSAKDKFIEKYSHFLVSKPLLVIGIILILVFFSTIFAGRIENETTNYSNSLPDDVPVILANNIFSDNFGSTESASIVIELSSNNLNSNEPRDIRNSEIITYSKNLEEFLKNSQQIESINSVANLLTQLNNGVLPKSTQDIKLLVEQNPQSRSYISNNNQMLLINLRLRDNYDEDKLVEDIEDAIQNIKKPVGIRVSPSGGSIAGIYVNRELGSDMAKTSTVSMVGIILILIFIFGSIKYGLLPLTTIIIGIFLTFGFIGLTGIKMSSATNGVISMIMGIGIDFGIQIITRFRQELKKSKKDIEKSMKNTLSNTFFPMFTTTLAAVIGFQSMSMGQLKVLSDMGNIMTYGVVFSFFAAVTFVPSFAIIIEKISKKFTTRR